MLKPRAGAGLILALLSFAPAAWAIPSAPHAFCTTYPSSPHCRASDPPCTLCHTAPPTRNAYGQAIEALLLPGQPRPLSAPAFEGALPAVLHMIETADADQDGSDNLTEIQAGTQPGDATSHPDMGGCQSSLSNPYYGVCRYDRGFVYNKILIDFCGRSATLAERQAFAALSETAQDTQLDTTLDDCMGSEHWIGPDQRLWSMAYIKIRPNRAFKSGVDPGAIPAGDYNDDFNYFTYTHTGDRDIRDLLLGQYYVTRSDTVPTIYTRVEDMSEHSVPRERRAGALTQRWFLAYFIMFAPLQRAAAAQAYRAFLGLDLARLEGLYPVAREPVDYDERGVSQPVCAACHSTLDPLSYPFRDYDGLVTMPYGAYEPNRVSRYFGYMTRFQAVPEAGSIFGQPVTNLREWATVAANSDAFLVATVRDYWHELVGSNPDAGNTEFVALWQGLRTQDNYQVRRMLHRFIRTNAYGIP
ncbi:MAG: hypothetical protein U1E65_19050 [Myxococcota bacterium]